MAAVNCGLTSYLRYQAKEDCREPFLRCFRIPGCVAGWRVRGAGGVPDDSPLPPCGANRNGRVWNVLTWATIGVITVLTVVMFVLQAMGYSA